MSNITLVLTRKPLQEFVWVKRHYEAIDLPGEKDKLYSDHGKLQSGRWGRLAVLEGPKVFAGRFSANSAPLPQPLPPRSAIPAHGGAAAGPAAPRSVERPGTTKISFADQTLELTTDGGAIKRVTEFDSMERFSTNSGVGHYVILKARPEKPYPVTMNVSRAVAELNQHGRCLRVHDHHQKKPGTDVDAGILVHEAPTIGWLIGCIAPRLKGNRALNHNRDPSRRAMDFIFDAMGGFRPGTPAALLVLDW